MAKLYLLPVTLGETPIEEVIPIYNQEITGKIQYFIVENVRTARRFLKKSNPEIEIDELTFFTLNKHTSPEILATYLQPIIEGNDIGLLSEAGCPAIADPGADIVAIAQQQGIKVIPLVGPSSIILSLMASGFNGQSFAFLGYLPIDIQEKATKIKEMERLIYTQSQTQIFIETPYRNDKTIEELIKSGNPQTKLCIACNITCEDAQIETHTLQEWKKIAHSYHKKNTIFLLYK